MDEDIVDADIDSLSTSSDEEKVSKVTILYKIDQLVAFT